MHRDTGRNMTFIKILIAALCVPLVSAVSLLRQQMEDRSLWIGLTTMTASLIPNLPPGPQSSFFPVWPAPAESLTSCTWSNRAGIWAIGGWSWPGPLADLQCCARTQGTESQKWHSLPYVPICHSSTMQIFCPTKVRTFSRHERFGPVRDRDSGLFQVKSTNKLGSLALHQALLL